MTTDCGDILIVVDEEELLKKHRQERKDLQSKIQSLKKSVPKGDKKKKKEVTEEIAKLEEELNNKIDQELSLVKKNDDCTGENNDAIIADPLSIKESAADLQSNDDEDYTSPSENTRISRAQKRRNKKATEEREREKRISEQAEKNKRSSRTTEMNQIKEKLKHLNLKLYNIDADGNCLYCAIIHQLKAVKDEGEYDVNELRKITAQFIRENKDDFLPFMYNEADESSTVSEEHFESYCNEVATTKLWGGQLELRALSNILKSPIKVIQASGPATVQGESFQGPELIITYHRHLYRLGEHYNSTLPDCSSRDSD